MIRVKFFLAKGLAYGVNLSVLPTRTLLSCTPPPYLMNTQYMNLYIYIYIYTSYSLSCTNQVFEGKDGYATAFRVLAQRHVFFLALQNAELGLDGVWRGVYSGFNQYTNTSEYTSILGLWEAEFQEETELMSRHKVTRTATVPLVVLPGQTNS